MTMVQKPGLIRRFKNMANNDAPKTTSGVAIGRKIKRLVVFLPLNLCLPSANAIMVPRIVAATILLRGHLQESLPDLSHYFCPGLFPELFSMVAYCLNGRPDSRQQGCLLPELLPGF